MTDHTTWPAINTAPRQPVTEQAGQRYGPRILVWWPGAAAPVIARWWSCDRLPGYFIGDDGRAVFPRRWAPA